MRAGLFAVLAFACGPAVSTTPRPIEHDLDLASPTVPEVAVPEVAVALPSAAPRIIAPPGKGLRTGTIARARLVAVLDAGPATFLRQLEVAPQLSGDRFIGWQLVQLLDHTGPLHDLDLVPGDVLMAINGKPLSRPEQLQTVWDSLRTANQVTAQMSRGAMALELRFAIDPPLR
jgi:S1-C subfamily serine protease